MPRTNTLVQVIDRERLQGRCPAKPGTTLRYPGFCRGSLEAGQHPLGVEGGGGKVAKTDGSGWGQPVGFSDARVILAEVSVSVGSGAIILVLEHQVCVPMGPIWLWPLSPAHLTCAGHPEKG